MLSDAIFRRSATNWSLLAATRFLLAMIVLNSHLAYFQDNEFTHFISLFDSRAAVIGFFVVSGFSVTSSFDRNEKNFLARRFLRIYPAYLFVTILTLLLQAAIGTYQAKGIIFSRSSAVDIVGNLLLLQMYLVKRLGFNPAYWSLSIEFSYYILLRYCHNLNKKYLVAIFLASLVYSILPANLSNSQAYQGFEKLYMVRCLWPFLVGIALARYPSTAMYLAVAALGAAATALSDWTSGPFQFITYLFTIFSIYVAQRGLLFDSIVMERLGDISYPLYLVHIPTGILFAAILGTTNPWIITAAALVISAFIAFVVESPFRNILKQLGSFRIFHERNL